MPKSLAQFISKIFSPFLIAPVTMLLVSLKTTNSTYSTLLYTGLFVLITILPALVYILIQMKRGVISDIHVKSREQRYLIYIIGIVSVSVNLAVLYLIEAPQTLTTLVLVLLIVGGLSYLINKKIKMSLHVATMAGATVIFYLLVGSNAGLVGLLLTVITIWSRVRIEAHTLREALLGFVVGLVVTFVTLRLLFPV